MTEWLEWFKTAGIPAAIAFFVLWRLDSRLGELSGKIDKLIDTLKKS